MNALISHPPRSLTVSGVLLLTGQQLIYKFCSNYMYSHILYIIYNIRHSIEGLIVPLV